MNKERTVRLFGWLLFVLAICLFLLQMGYFILQSQIQVEYIDNRLFYIINIAFSVFLLSALIILIPLSKAGQVIATGIIIIFIAANSYLLGSSNYKVKNISSISPDWKHVLSIKENQGRAVYNRTYYGIFSRPKDAFPNAITGDLKIMWLTNDASAVTYKGTDNKIHQFIATYGDRGNGGYYHVGAEIHGSWQGENVQVISNTEGISVTENGITDQFEWGNIVQFGTLAVVLTKDDQAVWTIALAENFKRNSNASLPVEGDIVLYKAEMAENQPITLKIEK